MFNSFRLTGFSLSLAIALVGLSQTKALGFSDIQSHWANQCIGQLASNRLVSGYPDNTFRPNQTVTRAEFAVLMLNLFPEAQPVRAATTFRDVAPDYWAARAIRQATERGFFAGYPDGTFQPTQAIPRVQAIAVTTNALNLPQYQTRDATLSRYLSDAAQIPSYARPAIKASLMSGTAVNYPNVQQLRPNQSATRGEIAALMCQARQLPGVPPAYVAGGQSAFAITPTQNAIGDFHNGLAAVSVSGKTGFINANGTLVIPPNFSVVRPFSEQRAAAGVILDARGTQWGFIDPQGNWVVQPQYEAAAPFSEGLAPVRLNNQVGFINSSGTVVIPAQYDDTLGFASGLAAVRVGQQWGFINPQGEWAIPLQDWTVYSFVGDRARVEIDQRTGFIDPTGKLAIPANYAAAQDFADGFAAALDGEQQRWGYLDRQGNWIIAPQFTAADPFSDGLAGVRFSSTAGPEGNGKWGFIDTQGRVAIAPQFYPPQAIAPSGELAQPYFGPVVRPFSQGLAMVRLGAHTGFIDRSGQFVIPPQFADAESFSEGLARVNAGGRWVLEAQGMPGDSSGPYGTRFDGEGKWGYIRLPSSMQ